MILCAGEALIDMLPRQSTDGLPAFAPHAGGAVFNTAIALGRLSADVQYYSGLSTDLFGDVLVDALKASKVDASPAHRSDQPTTLAFVKLVDGHATYAFYDENTAGRMLPISSLPKITADALFFGGISLAVTPCADTYEALLTREAASKVIMIDPNIRPSFIRDEAAFRARMTRIMALSDIIKLSDDDMAWLFPDEAPMDAGARLVADGICKIMLITQGSEGVTAFSAHGSVQVAAQKAQVVDTVGAGDTFNAGVLASLSAAGVLTKAGIASLDKDALTKALEMGAKTAAITVSRAGANPPWASEL